MNFNSRWYLLIFHFSTFPPFHLIILPGPNPHKSAQLRPRMMTSHTHSVEVGRPHPPRHPHPLALKRVDFDRSRPSTKGGTNPLVLVHQLRFAEITSNPELGKVRGISSLMLHCHCFHLLLFLWHH